MKYYTVKDVQNRTRLTRQQLKFFKDVIKPVYETNDYNAADFENSEYKGYIDRKYKVYDQEAMEKLVEASILLNLGLKPQEVKEKFNEEHDVNEILDCIIKISQEQIEKFTYFLKTAQLYKNNKVSMRSNPRYYNLLTLNNSAKNDYSLLLEAIREEGADLEKALKSEENMDMLDAFLLKLVKCVHAEDMSWQLIERVNNILDEMADFSEDVLGVSWGYFFTSQVIALTCDNEYKYMVENIICNKAGAASSIASYIECYQWEKFISYIEPEIEKCTRMLNKPFSANKLDGTIEGVLNKIAYCFGKCFKDVQNASLLINLSMDPSKYFYKGDEIQYLLDAILYKYKENQKRKETN